MTTTTDPTALAAVRTVADVITIVDELAIASAEKPRSRILRPALITQLRDAIIPSLGSTGTGRGGGRGVPVDVGAWTLWEDVTTRIEALHEDLEGEAPATGSHEQILLAWSRDLVAVDQAAPHGLNQDTIAYALHRVTRIRDLIAHHFDPPRTGDLPGAACLSCGEKTGTVLVDDAETPAPAIHWTLTRDGSFTVHCRVCDETWTTDGLNALDRYKWARRRDERVQDLTTPLTDDDWHHLRLDLRDAATQPHPPITWPTPEEQQS